MASSSNQTNCLKNEKSPYLKLHAEDPVAWNIWGEEPFTKARASNRLVFLSIGYSTCHWCHVMARESFTDPEVAGLINSKFVPVLVDCEERPDINQLYMKACRVFLDGNGGWPLNVVLTPDHIPIFACVYLPKKQGYGRPGLMETLENLAAEWQSNPALLIEGGRDVLAKLQGTVSDPKDGSAITNKTISLAVRNFTDEYDPRNGGFGPDPRFIRPHGLMFLIRHARKHNDAQLMDMVKKTLKAIYRGGITDQLVGGVHRYSTDIFWCIPHFEKMIYDQAGVILAYIEAYKATGDETYTDAARQVTSYVLEDMSSPEGLFYAGEDASINGVEGEHFIWKKAEIEQILGTRESELFCRAFEVSEAGNFRKDAQGEGTNVLHRRKTIAELAAETGLERAELAGRLNNSRRILKEKRRQRPLPAKDKQQIIAWNAYIISALARAAHALSEPDYLAAAERAADYILNNLKPDNKLVHCRQDGELQLNGFAADYVYFCRALLDLYEVTFTAARFQQALTLAGETIQLFHDEAHGGLFEIAEGSEKLVLRLKEFEEREMPSTNSVALELFSRLWLMTGDNKWYDLGESIRNAFPGDPRDMPGDYPWLMDAVDKLIDQGRKIVFAAGGNDQELSGFLSVYQNIYAPDAVFMLRPKEEQSEDLPLLPESIKDMKPISGRTAIYICEGFSCRPPIKTPEEFKNFFS